MDQENNDKLERLSRCGYSSLNEYEAFSVVDTKAQVLCLLARNNLNGVRAIDVISAETKDQKLVLYKKLGLVDFLKETLSMTDEERIRTKIDILEGSISKILAIGKEIEEEIFRELEKYQNGSTEDGTARTLNDGRRLKHEKALTEALSSGARALREEIQQRRDKMYEEMIEEAGEIESPRNRLH